MTTTETPMQRIERAERDALRFAREDPTERQDREQAERDAIAADQRAEREALAEAERAAAATALVTEQAAQARATQLAEDAADELRIRRVLALASLITEAESRLTPQIDKAQKALDQSIAADSGVGAMHAAWSALRVASAELWNTTVEARRSIALAKNEPIMDDTPGPLDALTFESVLTMALDARVAPTLATIKVAVAAAYTDADAAPTTQRRRR